MYFGFYFGRWQGPAGGRLAVEITNPMTLSVSFEAHEIEIEIVEAL